MLHTKSFRLAHATLEANAEKLLRFNSKFHRQLFEHLFAKAVDDHIDGIFRRNAPLPAVEQLILADFRRRCFVLHLRAIVEYFEVRKSMRAALIAEEQGVTLRIISCPLGGFHDLYQSAIGILPMTRRNAFGRSEERRVGNE